MNNLQINKSYAQELRRKLFHLISITIPILYYNLGEKTGNLVLIIITCFVVAVDILRKYITQLNKIVESIFVNIMRKQEIEQKVFLSGSSNMFLGFLITSLFFKSQISITSWMVLIISDAAAAIFGMAFGKKKINGKTIVGSFAFFTSSILVSYICIYLMNYDFHFYTILLSCLVCTFVEFFSKNIKMDDNLTIPLSFCIAFSFFAGIGVNK